MYKCLLTNSKPAVCIFQNAWFCLCVAIHKEAWEIHLQSNVLVELFFVLVSGCKPSVDYILDITFTGITGCTSWSHHVNKVCTWTVATYDRKILEGKYLEVQRFLKYISEMFTTFLVVLWLIFELLFPKYRWMVNFQTFTFQNFPLCYGIVMLHTACSLYRVVQFLSRCQDKNGGFGGGPGQLAHLAPTYAAVLSLCILGTQEAFDCIDRYVCGIA